MLPGCINMPIHRLYTSARFFKNKIISLYCLIFNTTFKVMDGFHVAEKCSWKNRELEIEVGKYELKRLLKTAI